MAKGKPDKARADGKPLTPAAVPILVDGDRKEMWGLTVEFWKNSADWWYRVEHRGWSDLNFGPFKSPRECLNHSRILTCHILDTWWTPTPAPSPEEGVAP